jgi:hypothetical protein
LEIIVSAPILGALIGGLILFQVHRYNAFKSASEKFRSTVLKELEGLYPTPAKWPSREMQIVQILRDKFPKLEVAVTEFREHLSCTKRKRFDEAWLKYNKEYYYNYIPIKGTSYARGETVYTTDYTTTYKDNFKHNVDDLLKFAKQS